MPDSNRTLCLIPARGGSKRIPRKNIRPFLGKPIIAYSIEAALASNLFDEVMVSTDDEEIAALSKQYGAQVPFMRSAQASDDHATTLDVVKEVIARYKAQERSFENICVIYPTAPFVTVEKLIEGAQKLTAYDAVIPVTDFSFPVWRAFQLNEGQLSYHWPEYEKSRSQDLTPLYHDAGQWYFIQIDKVKDTLVPQNTSYVHLSNLEVQDIDTLDDWRIAELKYEHIQGIR